MAVWKETSRRGNEGTRSTPCQKCDVPRDGCATYDIMDGRLGRLLIEPDLEG